MGSYAVVNDGTVINVIIAESQEIAEEVTGLTCVEYENSPAAPGIGWSYDGATFTAPITE